MFSAFPAATVSTFLITYFAHGAKFSAGIAKSAMLGAIGVVLYAILIRFTYNSIGVIPGTIIATLGSFFVGYLIYRFVLSKLN